MVLPVLELDSAPESARLDLAEIKQQYRFVPNVAAVLANAPAVLKGYWSLARCFELTSLSPGERQVVLLTTSVANECRYCVAAHSLAAAMAGLDPAMVDAIRQGQQLADRRLEALRRLTAETVSSRGWPERDVVEEFLAAGFTAPQSLEVLLGITVKTLSNYTNHLVALPLDAQFASAKWTPAEGSCLCPAG